MEKIFVPHLGVNDHSVRVIDWHVKDNDYVENGKDICSVETTKATFEVQSHKKGYIRIVIEKDTEIDYEQCLALIVDDPDFGMSTT